LSAAHIDNCYKKGMGPLNGKNLKTVLQMAFPEQFDQGILSLSRSLWLPSSLPPHTEAHTVAK